MTQPRKQQIKSVDTHFAVLGTSVTPGSASLAVSPSSFQSPPGGADQDIPAMVQGTSTGPYPVLAGDSFTVSVDGAPAVTVVLASSDTTSGRVALKINAAVGSAIAADNAGHLVIASPTAGAASSLKLAEISPGVLSKFGIPPGTFPGVAAGTDGLLTLTPDGRGGLASVATADGRNLVTDGGKLVYYASSSGARRMMQLTPGGVPVRAGLTFDGTNAQAAFCYSAIQRARVRSFGSFFSLLDNTNTLTLNVNGVAFSTVFSSGPYTRDGVLDAINSAYASAAGITDTWARADGTIPGPFRSLNGQSIVFSVDGGSPVTVTFTTESTVAEVVGKINASVPGLVALSAAGPSGTYLAVRSSNTNGRTSSIKVWSPNQGLARVGISPGFYGGCYVADQYGPNEIEIFSVFRGSANGASPSISVSGTGTTLSRVGLTATTVPGSTTPDVEPVGAPFLGPDMSSTTAYSILLCYPQVLEFGDVPVNAEDAVQRFVAKSAGSNIDLRNIPVDDFKNGVVVSAAVGRGFFDVGKPVIVGPDGSVSGSSGGADSGSVDSVVKQITRLSATDVVQAVVGNRFETPGTGTNPLPPSPTMDFVADPGVFFPSSAKLFRFYADPSSPALYIVDDPSASVPADGTLLGLKGGFVLRFLDQLGKISDPNIRAADTTDGYIRLSSPQDDYLKPGGAPALPGSPGTSAYNVLRSLNARYSVSVGDGTVSFGDFSGPDSISQAVAFLRAASVARCHIVVKPGNYSESAGIDFTGFTDVTLEGVHPQGNNPFLDSVVSITNSVSTALSFPTPMNSIVIRNLDILASSPTNLVLLATVATFVVEDCRLNGHVSVTNPASLRVTRLSQVSGSRGFTLSFDDTIPASRSGSLVFEDSDMGSAQDNPVIAVVDNTSSALVLIECISIIRCAMSPGTATFNGINPSSPTARTFVSAAGAGIISLLPSQNAYQSSGLIVASLEILRTKVFLGVHGTLSNASFVALNVVPSGPQGSTTWSYSSSPAVRLDNVRVEDMDISFAPCFNVQMQSPCFLVAGVGIPPYSIFSFGNTSVGTLTVKRVHVDAGQSIQGPATANSLPFLNNYSNVNIADSAQAGLICVAGRNVVVEDLSFTNTVDLNGQPELFALGYAHLNIRGFETQPTATYETNTLLTNGNARLYVRDVFGAQISVRDVYMDGGGQFNATWSNQALLVVEGGATDRMNTLVSGFVIQGFFFSFAVPAILGKIATAHPNWPTNQRGGSVMFEKGYVGNHGSGPTNGPSFGIEVIVTSSSTSADNVHVRDVVIDSMQTNGIFISVREARRPISVQNCTVFLCGNVNGFGGIRLSTQNLTTTSPTGTMTVRDNVCQLNNVPSGGYSGVQINVRDIGSAHRPTFASVYGNYCFDNVNSVYGLINSCVNGNTNFPSSGYYLSVPVHAFGLETGYTGQTGSFATFGNGYLWTTPFRCMHNDAGLSADFSNVS